MSLLIAEILHDRGVIKHFASNIKIYDSPFHIEHIINLEDLEDWCKLTKERKLFIGDEWGKSMRRRPMSEITIQLMDNLQTLRKYQLSLVVIAPADKYVDSSNLGSDVLDVEITKPHFNNPKVALYRDRQTYFETWLEGIPRTLIRFDTYDIAPFVLHRKLQKPKFKDKDLNILWEWSHGKTASELGLYRMQINRLTKKFIKETLEKTRNK